MTLWRLEWLRTIRTKKWLALAVAYLFFGLTGPPLTRYTSQIVKRFGGGANVAMPKPTAADGIASYTKNAGQIGLIVLIAVAAGTLALDANTEWSVFLRTRVRSTWRLVVPRFAGTTLLGAVMFVLGTLGAWYETRILLGSVSPSAMLIGTVYGVVFIAFVVCVVAFATTLVRSVVGVVGFSLAGILFMPIAGLLHSVKPWLPTELVDAMHGLVAGAHAGDFVRATVVSLALGALFLWLTALRLDRREI